MPSPLSSARLGSGGVSIGVGFDIDAGIAQLRQAVAAQEKNLKAKPKVEWDFQEAAVTRGVRAVINKIQREAASIDVAFRLKDAGLLDAAKRAGALSPSQLAALTPATPAIFARALTPGGVNTLGAFQRLSPQALFSRDDIDANMSAAGASLRDARKQAAMRVATEAKLAREDNPLAQLADAASSSRPGRTPSNGGMGLRGAVRLGGYAYAARLGLESVSALAQYGTASDAAHSSSSAASLQGQLAQFQSAENIPGLGRIVKAFDDITRTSLKLQSTMKGEEGLREHAVAMAGLSRSPIGDLKAKGERRIFDTIAEYEASGVSTPASRAHIAGVVQEEKAKLDRSTFELANQIGGLDFQVGNIRQASARQPRSAMRAALVDAGQREWRLNANPDIRQELSNVAAAKLAAFDVDTKRQRDLADYNTATGIGAAQIRINNKGVAMEDENAFLAVRRVLSTIDQANLEGGDKRRAKFAGLAELRGLKSGLSVRGGGITGATNLATDLVGDPFNLMPETQARLRAGSAYDAGLKRIGEAGAAQIPAIASKFLPQYADMFSDINLKSRTWSGERAQDLSGRVDDRQDDVTSAMLKVMEEIRDQLGKKVIMLPN